VLLTKEIRARAILACHDLVFSGHFGRTRTTHLVERVFTWPDSSKDIADYCKSRLVCQGVKAANHKPYGRLKPLHSLEHKWSDVTVDMIVHLPETLRGFTAILVFVDRLTKMVHIVPTKDELDSIGFCELFIEHVIRLHGVPKRLVSDRGSIFASKFTQAFTSGIDCIQNFSTAYHPQSDGQTERANRVIEDVLRCYVDTNQKNWDTLLPMVEFAMNNAPSDITGQTPFVLNYGVNPRHPAITKLISDGHAELTPSQALRVNAVTTALQDTFRDSFTADRTKPDVPMATQFSTDMRKAVEHTQMLIEAARSRMIRITDKSRIVGAAFEEGQQVMLSTKYIKLLHEGCDKLTPRYAGPFPLEKAIWAGGLETEAAGNNAGA